MNPHRTLAGFLLIACAALSSCAYVGYTKGVVAAVPSGKDRWGHEWTSGVTLEDPPVTISILPYPKERILLAGPCILLPLAIIPNLLHIPPALWKHRKWETPAENLRVKFNFKQLYPPGSGAKPSSSSKYAIKLTDVRLKIANDLLLPAATRAECIQYEPQGKASWRTIACANEVKKTPEGAYLVEEAPAGVQQQTTFEAEFHVPANSLEKASLLIEGISLDEKLLKIPAISIARRRWFSLGCVAGEGTEWQFFTY